MDRPIADIRLVISIPMWTGLMQQLWMMTNGAAMFKMSVVVCTNSIAMNGLSTVNSLSMRGGSAASTRRWC
jgi:hypothetical protein